jgi:2-succinyl-6-hydroxy-2,4-cyclohexadiene-1-carboxylate synthase
VREERIRLESGVTLRVRIAGSGATLLMLHGFASGIDGWPEEQIDRLASGRCIVLVDLPGHGGSDPVGEGGWEPDRIVHDLVELVGALTGREEADWLGYSMGGRIALHAARVGAPVGRLLLESTTPGLRGESERSARRDSDARWARRFAAERLDSVLDDWLAQPIFATRDALPPAERHRQVAVRRAAHGPTLARALLEAGTGSLPPAWSTLPRIADRVHLLVGERDEKYLRLAREMTAAAPRIRLEIVPGVGHAPHMEAPEAWAAWVERSGSAEGGATGRIPGA